MDKNEILSDKEKYSEKFQRLLNNCSSGDINQYIFGKNPELLTIDLEKYSKLNLLEKKTYVWNKLEQTLKLHPLLKNYVMVLVETMKLNKSTLFLLEDNIKLVQEHQILKEKYNKMINNLEIFMDYQPNKDEIRFSEKEIDGIIYSQVNKALGKYIREQTDHLNASLKDEFKVNIDRIRINYEDKKKNLENIFEEKYKNIISNKIKEIKTDIYKFKDSFDNLKIKLRKCLFNKRIGKGLGIINKFNKDIKRRYVEFDVKYFDFNSIPEINIIQEKFNIFNNKLEKFSNNNNIIYEDFEQDKEETKFDNPNKNSNKIESIFNKDLLDINKNIFENKSKNYISKNNLINKDFNFNKNNLKNIFKNQKNT